MRVQIGQETKRKASALSLLWLSTCLLSSCTLELIGSADGGSSSSSLSSFSVGLPSLLRVNSNQTLNFTLSRLSEGDNLTNSQISYTTTGTASCDPPSISGADSDNPVLTITNCSGDGRVTVEVNGTSSELEFLVSNTLNISWGQPESVVINATETTAYVLDTETDALVSVDLSTGIAIVISDDNTGTGTNFVGPNAVSINTSETTAYVADGIGALYSVDLATGNRAIVSDSGTGTGTNFGTPISLVTNAAETLPIWWTWEMTLFFQWISRPVIELSSLIAARALAPILALLAE